MPDPTVDVSVVLSALPQEAKDKVAKATPALWKRVLSWCGGILGIAAVALLAGWWLVRKKSPTVELKKQLDANAAAVERNNQEARTKVLEAELKQRAEVAEIAKVVANPDRAAKVAEMERISNAVCAEVNKP